MEEIEEIGKIISDIKDMQKEIKKIANDAEGINEYEKMGKTNLSVYLTKIELEQVRKLSDLFGYPTLNKYIRARILPSSETVIKALEMVKTGRVK